MDVEELRRRRQAITALAWFPVAFFVVTVSITVGQAIHYGYGLVHGRVRADAVGDQAGYGLWGDALAIAASLAACALLLAAWFWLGSRLSIGTARPALTQEEVDAQPFYIVEIPKITRALVIMGCMCAAFATLFGAAMFPFILVKYGW